MRHIYKIIFTFIMFMLIAISAEAAGRVEFILDVSGSMNAAPGGQKKIAVARQAVASAVQNIPDGSVVALRLYGHRVPNAEKEKSCKDSELVIPFGPIEKQKFLAAVNAATPLGQTPIAFSLEEAAKDFGAAKDEATAIILVSDGEETCGGDPLAVAKRLLAEGFKVTIHTIGFDVDAKTRAQLEAVSQITGGQYRDARDAAGLKDSLEQLTKESFVIEKEKSVYGEPIRGGDSYETAVAISPDKLYRLDHHQKKGYFDYFYVDVKGGQKLTAIIQTGEKGVTIRDENATENANPYAGIQIHNAAHASVVHDTIIGTRSAKKEMWINLNNEGAGRYYILLGNTYDDQHKDNPFKIEILDRFDAGTDRDAGENEAAALTVAPGEYISHLGPGDKTDVYAFNAQTGAAYDIKARGTSDDLKLRMTIHDSDGINLATADAPNPGAAVKVDGFKPTKAGTYFINLSSFYTDVPLTDYTLNLAQSTGTVAETSADSASKTAVQKPQSAAEVETLAKTRSPFDGLSLWEKIKFIMMFSGIPLAAGLIIGFIIGFLKGRKK